MQPQDPYGPPQAYPPQGPPQGIPQPQIPGQTPAQQPGFNPNAGTQPTAQTPYESPLPTYQPPASTSQFTPNNSQPNLAPPPDAPSTPYDFFMQPKHAVPSRPLPMGGRLIGTRPNQAGAETNGTKKIIIFAIAGALGVLVILMGIILFSPKNPAPTQFFGIAQLQQELIRVCSQGMSKAKYQSTRNFAITCATGVTNSQKELLAYMQKANYSYDPKLIGAKANSQNDSRLSKAISSSTYDDTFREIVETQLTSYNRSLTAQLSTTTTTNGRELLTKNQQGAELLLKMVADDSDKTEAPVETTP